MIAAVRRVRFRFRFRLRFLGAVAVASLFVAGACGYSPEPENGKQDCASPASSQRCVDGYYCAASDGKCWKDGTGPGATGGTGGVVGTAGTGGPGTAGRGGTAGSVSGVAGTGGVTATGGVAGSGVAGAGAAGTTGTGGAAGVAGTGGRGGTGTAGTVGTGGTSGTVGSAGTTGTGGRGGTTGAAGAGTAGTTGTAGRGGTTGTAGRGGTGGTGPATYTLTVSAPTGGKVTDSGGNINCGATCTHAGYAPGTTVTLSAQASSGYQFTAWSGGGCSGNNLTCIVTLNSDVTVTATFTQVHVLTVVVLDDDGCRSAYTAGGTVSFTAPSGLTACMLTSGTQLTPSHTCAYNILNGTAVTLAAMPTNGSLFDGPPSFDCGNNSSQSGSCTPGSSGTCTCMFTMNAARTVTASVCRD